MSSGGGGGAELHKGGGGAFGPTEAERESLSMPFTRQLPIVTRYDKSTADRCSDRLCRDDDMISQRNDRADLRVSMMAYLRARPCCEQIAQTVEYFFNKTGQRSLKLTDVIA